MFKFISYSLLCFLSIPLFIACTKEQAFLVEPEPEPIQPEFRIYPNVDEALWPYFQRFEEEAFSRGLEVDLITSEITGVIEEIDTDNVLGECRYNSHLPEHVTIDKTFWSRASDRAKEFVVFHELGHCSLLRDHFESTAADGTCVSIMRSGVEDCRDNYRTTTRVRYLNELFNPDRVGDWF